MKYDVSFYNNMLELLTERKANFVNQMKALSSKILNEIGKKVGGTEKTTGKSIVKFLSNMVENRIDKKSITVTIDGWDNPKLEYLPNTGKPIPVKVNFINQTNTFNEGECKYSGEGHCALQAIRGEVFITEVKIDMNFALSPDQFDKTWATSKLISEFHRIIVHEIAHGHDKLGFGEWGSYKKKANTSHRELKYLHYWLKPTEIRSHMNEMIQILNSETHQSPKRTFRNMYRDSDKAREYGIDYTDEQKANQKKAFSMMTKHNASKTLDEKSYTALSRVLNSAWTNGCAKSLKNFIINYHIAFVRDSHPTMKQRYYDKYFPNTDVPSLDNMNDVYDAIQTIYRTLTRLENDIKKHHKYDRLYGDGDEYRTAMQAYYKLENNILDTPPLSDAIEKCNTKLIKKATKEIIEKFREEHGYLTKGMITKQYKNSSGLEDFFNSDPSSVRR